MRRLLTLSLVVLFGLPLITPLFALSPETQPSVHACCRRSGAHRCVTAMRAVMDQDGVSGRPVRLAADSRCSVALFSAVSPADHLDLMLDREGLLFAGVVSYPAMQTQAEARARIALDRSRRKRGPPSQGFLA